MEGFDDLVASDLLARRIRPITTCAGLRAAPLAASSRRGPASQSAARGIVHQYLLPRQDFEERFWATKNVSALMVYHAAAAAAPPQ